jgi:hypothetical protein
VPDFKGLVALVHDSESMLSGLAFLQVFEIKRSLRKENGGSGRDLCQRSREKACTKEESEQPRSGNSVHEILVAGS